MNNLKEFELVAIIKKLENLEEIANIGEPKNNKLNRLNRSQKVSLIEKKLDNLTSEYSKENKGILTFKNACNYLEISKSELKMLVKYKLIPFYLPMPKTYIFLKSEIECLQKSLKTFFEVIELSKKQIAQIKS